MKASLANYKQSPRKVRLVADMIRGKSIAAAKDALHFLPKKSAPEMQKLLASAIANARNAGMNPDDLVIQSVSVDKGRVFRRFMPKARGRAAGVRKTMSHVTLVLGPGASKSKPKKKPAKTARPIKAATK